MNAWETNAQVQAVAFDQIRVKMVGLETETPIRSCVDGCGRTRRTWQEYWRCRFCVLETRIAFPESFRQTRRRLAGRCVVCGLDPCGCEFGPRVGAR